MHCAAARFLQTVRDAARLSTVRHRLLPAGLLALSLAFSPSAHAGSIAFGLSQTGTVLTLTLNGDSSAFYPAVFRMVADGRWEPLAPLAAKGPPVEMTSGMQFDVAWPNLPALETLPPLERLRPVMVRFFDQAGVSFGQISLLELPRTEQEPLRTRYEGELLAIEPPRAGRDIRASWLLYPQEEGIAPIVRPVRFSHVQPPARRIEWHAGSAAERIATGYGQPSAILLHETPQGYTMQLVSGGGRQGRQQRAAWLDGSEWFYGLASAALAAALLLAGASGVRRHRARRAA